MLYDITAKDLCKYYPVYTKAGFIWKNRINWEVIQVPGNKVKTYFGIFTFLRAYKVDKVWYWVLTDGTKTITVKRDQARRNKKLPKTATVQTTLVSVQPKELTDQLADIVRPMGEQLTYDLLIKQNGDSLKMKISAIALILSMYCDDSTICKKIYRDLCFYYHPDRNTQDTTDIYQHIQSSFEQWLNTK